MFMYNNVKSSCKIQHFWLQNHRKTVKSWRDCLKVMVKVAANVVNQGVWYKLQPSVMHEKGLATHFIASCSRSTKRSLHETHVFCDRSTKCNQHSSINSTTTSSCTTCTFSVTGIRYLHCNYKCVASGSTFVRHIGRKGDAMRTAVALVTCWVFSSFFFFFVGWRYEEVIIGRGGSEAFLQCQEEREALIV